MTAALSHAKLFLLFTLAATGCAATASDDETESAESATTAAPAQAIIDEGALAVANAASVAFLTRSVDDGGAGLVASAASSIAAFRLGPDGKPFTADDRQLTTIAALDAVPGVGPVTIRRLRELAAKTPVTIEGVPPLSLAEVGRLVTGQRTLHGQCADHYGGLLAGNYGVGGGGAVKQYENTTTTSATVTVTARRRADAGDGTVFGFVETEGFRVGWGRYELVVSEIDGGKENALPNLPVVFDLALVLGKGAGGAIGFDGQTLRLDAQKNLVYSLTRRYTDNRISWVSLTGTLTCKAQGGV